CNWPAPFQIADDRPISLAAPKSEVVNADDGELISRLFSPPAHDTQQSIVAHRQHQPFGNGCGGPAAQRQPQVVHGGLEAAGPAGLRRQHVGAKPPRKAPTAAKNRITPEATDRYAQDNAAACEGQSGSLPHTAAVRTA